MKCKITLMSFITGDDRMGGMDVLTFRKSDGTEINILRTLRARIKYPRIENFINNFLVMLINQKEP